MDPVTVLTRSLYFCPAAFELLNDAMRARRDVAAIVMPLDGRQLKHASRALRADRGIVLEAVAQSGDSLRHAAPQLRADVEVALAAVKQSAAAIGAVGVDLKRDKQFCLRAVAEQPRCIGGLPAEMQRDPEVLLLALRRDGAAFEEVKKVCWVDRALFLLVAQNSRVPRVPMDLYGSDAEVLVAALSRHGELLGDVSDAAMLDRLDVVEAAVLNYGPAIYYASERLRGDPGLVLKAVAQGPEALHYAADGLRGDAEFIKRAYAAGGQAVLYHFAPALRADREFMLWAVDQGGGALKFATQALWADRELVERALRAPVGSEDDLRCLQYAAPRLAADPELVLLSMQRAPPEYKKDRLLDHAAESLLADKQFMLRALDLDADCLYYAASSLLNDGEVAAAALRRKPELLGLLPEALRNQKQLVMLAVSHEDVEVDVSPLKWVGYPLWSDLDVTLAAVHSSSKAKQHLHPKFKYNLLVLAVADRDRSKALQHLKLLEKRVPANMAEVEGLGAAILKLLSYFPDLVVEAQAAHAALHAPDSLGAKRAREAFEADFAQEDDDAA